VFESFTGKAAPEGKSKFRTKPSIKWSHGFGNLNLDFVWNLMLEIWNFKLTAFVKDKIPLKPDK